MLKRKAKLTELSSREKRACRAHWIDGLTHAEIGRREGLSKWASMKRVQRARRKLREMAVNIAKQKGSYRTTAFQLGVLENV